ncbi:hypothetical protein PG996_008149 [Apiospora saccharicola]|uniref:Prion-inhibition and propagation HeLo domain-containing protein n=1 Tax=Apiospora saccharicola TaxID=335842 RepID=A0ABR1UX37_9PEZI
MKLQNFEPWHFSARSSAFLTTVTKRLEGEFSNIAEILTLDQRILVQVVKWESAQLQRRPEASKAPTTSNKKQDLFSMESTIEHNQSVLSETTLSAPICNEE